MRPRLVSESVELGSGWLFARAEAGAFREPRAAEQALAFEAALVPGTVGSELQRRGKLDLSSPPALDASDYWYVRALEPISGNGKTVLVLEGLATLAEVWLGDTLALCTDNMHRRYELDVSDALAAGACTLAIRFCSADAWLAAKRPRPRYKTRIVDQQQLRWLRTSLLGRTPGFCPRVPSVGPYRAIRLEKRPHGLEPAVSWRADVNADGTALLEFELALVGHDDDLPLSAELELTGAAVNARLPLAITAGAPPRLHTNTRLDKVALWWPHTHGPQPRADARVHLRYRDGSLTVELGRVGFRKLERDPGCAGLALRVNGVPVFCRGASYLPDDVLNPGVADARRTLELARDAGMNMIRISGTSAYPNERFYELCDELGILVFQDFMFANMDYPSADAGFVDNVQHEASSLLGDLQGRPCLAVLAGGSEVEQQAAMMGAPPSTWENPLFHEILPAVAGRLTPDVPYVPSTPCGGALPFHPAGTVSHYYGVGAYLRPLTDARVSGVSFAAECLAFANVPEEATIAAFMQNLETPPHHPRWKERVPRDRGVGWDFEDVRDHYTRELFGLDPLRLRYSDVERYLALGRVTTAELMERVFADWRRPESTVRGGLVWWLNDLWPGAGWGVIDALGRPKAAYYALARAFAPIALSITNEGLNGFALHATNDSEQELAATLDVALYRDGKTLVASNQSSIAIAGRTQRSFNVEGLLGAFHDASYSYRFGPPACDLVVARLIRAADGVVVGRAFGFPLGIDQKPSDSVGLSAEWREAKEPTLVISAERFAAFVHVEAAGFRPSDDYFHLAPGERHTLRLIACEPGVSLRSVHVSALNARQEISLSTSTKRSEP